MFALRIGLDLQSLAMPLREALHAAAGLGADAVVIDARGAVRSGEFSRTAVRELRKMLEDFRLRVAAISYRTRRGLVTMDELDRRVDGTKAAMEIAHSLGANVVIGTLGPLPPPDSESWQVLAAVLDDVGRHGHRVGAMLAAETGTDGGETLAGLLRVLPEGTLGIDFNPGNLVISGLDPREAVHALGAWILHVHASDALFGLTNSRGVRVPLGEGSVDMPALLGALEEFGYRGYITIDVQPADDALRQAATAIRYLRRL